MIYRFVCAEHEEFGSLGWKLQNMPAFDPLPGMGVAHDILEHLPHDDSTAGELMALGAMFHVRGEDYFVNKGRAYHRPSYHCHGEIAELLNKIDNGEWIALRDCPHLKTHSDEYVQLEIDDTIDLVKKYLRDDLSNGYEMDKATEDKVRGFLAHGYRSAVRRYRHVDRSVLLDTFNEIEERADNALKHVDKGEVLKVKLVWKSGIITDARYPELAISSGYEWDI